MPRDFNATQQYVYNISYEFLIDKLDTLLEKSKKTQSGLNAVCFLLYITLKHNRSTVEKIAEIIYPEVKYQIVKDIFLEIHGLLSGTIPDHSFVKSISDPRFFLDKGSMRELQDTIAQAIKQDLERWLERKYEANIVSQPIIQDLEQYYQSSLIP